MENGPGGPWEAPFSLRIRRLRIQFRRLVGFCSLLPPLTAGQNRLGPLAFTWGFRIKELEVATIDGVELYLEDGAGPPHEGRRGGGGGGGGGGASPEEGGLRRGTLLKLPRTGFGQPSARLAVLEPTALVWFTAGSSAGKPRGAACEAAAALLLCAVSSQGQGREQAPSSCCPPPPSRARTTSLRSPPTGAPQTGESQAQTPPPRRHPTRRRRRRRRRDSTRGAKARSCAAPRRGRGALHGRLTDLWD